MATIREKGAAQWQAQIRRRGYPAQSKTFRTKREAERWATAVEATMDRGQFVDRTPAERTTLREVLERYRDEVSVKRPGESSRISEVARINRILREESDLCAYAVANLRPEHFEQYRDRRLTQNPSRGRAGGRGQYREVEHVVKLRRDGTPRANASKPKPPPKAPRLISPSTVKRELTLLKRAIDHVRRRLGLSANPVDAQDVRRPVVQDERKTRIQGEDARRLLEACRRARKPWLGAIVELAIETGARRGNLLRLRWEDVDLTQRVVTLHRVKNSRSPDKVMSHRAPLSARASEILRGLPRSLDGRVFPVTEAALKSAFDRARAQAGLEHLRFHDTRHERASSLHDAGIDPLTIMTIIGHRDIKSVARYVAADMDRLIERLDEIPARGSKKKP